MRYINSFLSSIVVYCLISYLLRLPDLLLSLVFTVVGSQISSILPRNYKNSLFIFVPIFVLILIYPLVFIPFAIGYGSCIFINLLSKNGCKLLYPLRSTTFTGPSNYLESNGRDEKAATTFLFVLAVLAVLFSLCGMQVISDVQDEGNIVKYYNSRPNGTEQSSYSTNSRYGENNSGYLQYVYIDPSKTGFNYNITTQNYNNTTTTIISEYIPPVENTTV